MTSPVESLASHNHQEKINGVRDAESLLSLRQSPPPVNDNIIPTGAIISPPDSSENSDGDVATSRKSRRKQVEHTWNELEQAVRSMSLKRDPSPNSKAVQPSAESTSEPVTQVVSPNGLTPEARKIAHSRSSTETAIIVSSPGFTESSTATSGLDESEDEDGMHSKPPLVRKKSGELVKPALRPSSRRRYSSMPGTPTYSKSVHFNDNGNQTRHFLQVDKPSAVSANTSPTETAYESENDYPFDDRQSNKTEWEIKLANFPEDRPERQSRPIRVERIFLSDDGKSLVGQVAVANISFHKAVVARFTLDYWKTTSEVSAEYSQEVQNNSGADSFDRFSFTIRLVDQANLENKTLFLCVRYNVSGQEYWDSNDNANYQVDFVKRAVKVSRFVPRSSLGARPVNAIPRSRHSPPASRGRPRAPSIEDDMGRFDNSASYHFGSSAKDLLGDDTQATIKLKPRTKRTPTFPGSAPQQPGGLGGRYDFGASLSAALSTAQDKLGKQSGLMQRPETHKKSDGYFSREAPHAGTDGPENVTSERPAIGSAQYKDLVSKFCYFTPPTSGKLSPQATTKSANTDGAGDSTDSNETSGTATPTAVTSVVSSLDGTNEKVYASPYISPYSSRTASPAGLNRSSRSHSSTTFALPYHKRDSYLSSSPAPTAIRG